MRFVERSRIDLKKLNLLGYDLGASSGRAMLGQFDGERITISELHRFINEPVSINGRLTWDTLYLFREMKQGLFKAHAQGGVDGMGIDTWGVDFGLLDKNGDLIGNSVHYRDDRTVGMMDEAFKVMPREQLFARTGLAFLQYNTLYQLLALKRSGSPLLDIADTLLMTPDLMGYFFTGSKGTEYTIASTGQLIDPATRDWARDIMRAYDLPEHIFTPLEQPGTVRGYLRDEIAGEVGCGRIPLLNAASHDTASAVAAVPAQSDNFVCISSGTWSIMGVELKQPATSVKVMNSGYSNEGGLNGTTRLMRNIMGLWIIQECKRDWDRHGRSYSFAEIATMAESAPPFQAVINVDDDEFLAPGHMPDRIADYCRRTGQTVPQSDAEIARIVFESLALAYRYAVESLENEVLGHKVDALNIVGGGSQNILLNRFTASALGKPVIAGPGEATVIGNLLVQAMALGEIGSLSELRQVVRASFDTREYLPEKGLDWDGAYARLMSLVKG